MFQHYQIALIKALLWLSDDHNFFVSLTPTGAQTTDCRRVYSVFARTAFLTWCICRYVGCTSFSGLESMPNLNIFVMGLRAIVWIFSHDHGYTSGILGISYPIVSETTLYNLDD